MILCQDVRMDLYLYQVPLTREIKITWKLVRNSLYTVYLSEIHCNDVWQLQKWITDSGVTSTSSHVQIPQPARSTHVCPEASNGILQSSGQTQDTGAGSLKLFPSSGQIARSLWQLNLVLGCFHCIIDQSGVDGALQIAQLQPCAWGRDTFL